MNERIRRLIKEHCKLSERAFAEMIGVSASALHNALTRNSYSYDMISRIIEVFPSISAEWLMRGEGDMIKDRATNSEEIEKLKLELARKDGMVDILLTQLKDNKPSGGAGEPLV